MFAVLIHVGQTPNVCGGRCPIYSDGTFRFVPIAVRHPRSDPDPTFAELGLAEFIPPELHNYPALRSPEFETFTYAHFKRPGEGYIYEKLRDEGGFLLFFSTLYYWDKKPPLLKHISHDHKAYLIGYFQIEGIYRDKEVASDPELQARFKANGEFGHKKETGELTEPDWWISGSKGRLFPKAVPLMEPSKPSKWNDFARSNLSTTGGKPLHARAFYNWTLFCPSQNLIPLKNWIRKFTGVLI